MRDAAIDMRIHTNMYAPTSRIQLVAHLALDLNINDAMIQATSSRGGSALAPARN